MYPENEEMDWSAGFLLSMYAKKEPQLGVQKVFL